MQQDKIMHTVAKLVGVPFKRGGRTPEEGLDCLGVILSLYRALDRPVPDIDICFRADEENAVAMADGLPDYTREITFTEMHTLDLVQFKSGALHNHLGVFLGSNQFLHVHEEVGVLIHRFADDMLPKVFSKVLRVKDEADWPHRTEALSEPSGREGASNGDSPTTD